MTGNNTRIFFVGGLISFRALFNWIKPTLYIPTMLGSTVFQIVFFVYLGRYARTGQNDAFFIVGNAVQVCGMSSVYGMTMAVANERQFGTLGPLLATPANRMAIFLGRGLPVLVNGLLVSATGFLFGIAVLHFRPATSTLPALVFVVVVTTLSCTAFGMLLGSIGSRKSALKFVAARLSGCASTMKPTWMPLVSTIPSSGMMEFVAAGNVKVQIGTSDAAPL